MQKSVLHYDQLLSLQGKENTYAVRDHRELVAKHGLALVFLRLQQQQSLNPAIQVAHEFRTLCYQMSPKTNMAWMEQDRHHSWAERCQLQTTLASIVKSQFQDIPAVRQGRILNMLFSVCKDTKNLLMSVSALETVKNKQEWWCTMMVPKLQAKIKGWSCALAGISPISHLNGVRHTHVQSVLYKFYPATPTHVEMTCLA